MPDYANDQVIYFIYIYKLLNISYNFAKKILKMGLLVTERENFRKAVKNIISQMKKSDLVAHFTKQGIARISIYNTFNRIQIGEPIKDNKRTTGPNTWTTATKKKFKRLTNIRTGVSQRRLGRKFAVNQAKVGRQFTKMEISYF